MLFSQKARLAARTVQTVRHGLPYEGNLGGAPEYRIPWDAQGKITVLNDLPFVVP
ncbi:hypothetical protein [Cryobacterium sp. TMT1-2-2]|uniref:hypothetical protein n=1 Tax=Cryobacterium sp. TMT1-2-2 TaxID=1259233 RepID=UPI00141B0B29|nr:hypothetical protein [Cryobacterium sp. TMT1-2-2]